MCTNVSVPLHLFKPSICSLSFEHTIHSNKHQRLQLWGTNIQWIRLHELFCSQNDWFLFGLGWMVDRILFGLCCFHSPCHTHQEKMVPPILRADRKREKELSALLFIKSSDEAKISRRTQLYIHLESGMILGHVTNLSHGFRLTFLQNLYSFY